MQRYEAIRSHMLGNTPLKSNNRDLALLCNLGMVALNMDICIDSPATLTSSDQIIKLEGHFKCARILSRMASSAMTGN